MRAMSAARMKGSSKGGPDRATPHAGTKLRELWDLFQTSRGLVIECAVSRGDRGHINQLRDFYGLDIRCLRYRRWCLVGEWTDKGEYVDYVAEQHPAGTELEEIKEEPVMRRREETAEWVGYYAGLQRAKNMLGSPASSIAADILRQRLEEEMATVAVKLPPGTIQAWPNKR